MHFTVRSSCAQTEGGPIDYTPYGSDCLLRLVIEISVAVWIRLGFIPTCDQQSEAENYRQMGRERLGHFTPKVREQAARLDGGAPVQVGRIES
ncbi:hypothetical protein [Haloferula sp.]|uniref:hypothetical protein n=1 Tax=Haloferula sp. TaxID=2497595 RepID=UPI00329D9316